MDDDRVNMLLSRDTTDSQQLQRGKKTTTKTPQITTKRQETIGEA